MAVPGNGVRSESAGPRVLVADDDAASLRFLGEALERLGAQVQCSPHGTDALQCARTTPFDLLLLDCRMPGMGAEDVLKQLRNDNAARSTDTPAIATSAELDAIEQRRLLREGFHAVLVKPCTILELQNVLTLAKVALHRLPVLNDDIALTVSGNPAIVAGLRKLFREELQHVYEQLDELSRDNHAFEARLHKLRSSCGFCGATSLAEHTASLQQQVKLAHRSDMLPLHEFRKSLLETMQALDAL